MAVDSRGLVPQGRRLDLVEIEAPSVCWATKDLAAPGLLRITATGTVPQSDAVGVPVEVQLRQFERVMSCEKPPKVR